MPVLSQVWTGGSENIFARKAQVGGHDQSKSNEMEKECFCVCVHARTCVCTGVCLR